MSDSGHWQCLLVDGYCEHDCERRDGCRRGKARDADPDDCRRADGDTGGDGAVQVQTAGSGRREGRGRGRQRQRLERERTEEQPQWQRASAAAGTNRPSATAICAARLMMSSAFSPGVPQALSRDVISHALSAAQISLFLPLARYPRGMYTQIQFIRPIQSWAPQPGPIHSPLLTTAPAPPCPGSLQSTGCCECSAPPSRCARSSSGIRAPCPSVLCSAPS